MFTNRKDLVRFRGHPMDGRSTEGEKKNRTCCCGLPLKAISRSYNVFAIVRWGGQIGAGGEIPAQKTNHVDNSIATSAAALCTHLFFVCGAHQPASFRSESRAVEYGMDFETHRLLIRDVQGERSKHTAGSRRLARDGQR